MFNFVPDELPISQIKVPFIEDVRTKDAPGYSTTLTERQLQAEIVELISQLGGGAPTFRAGAFEGTPTRYGYLITFSVMGSGGQGINCRMYVAGLPIRTFTEVRKSQVMRQALFAFRDYLRGELNALMFRPGYSPFVQHMVLPTGKTLNEEYVAREALLPLGGPLLLEAPKS